MFKKIAIAIGVLVAFQFLFTNSAAGQGAGPGCSVIVTANDLGIDLGVPVPSWAKLVYQNTTIGLGLLNLYQVMTNKCHPPCQCPKDTAGSPIILGTGDTYITETDVAIPGLSNGLKLVRTWNSMWPASGSGLQIGLFGPNWRSTFEERIFVGSDYYIKYARADGSIWSFGINSAAGAWSPAAPANASATLVTGPAHWTLTFQNGEQRIFDNTTGSLLSITDRNGNVTQLTYDSSNRLVTVTDPVSRHLYFNYPNGSSFLVTSVTSDIGITLSYAYDTQGRLSQVTKPDLTTVNFTYNSQSLITAVTDSNGKILESHTYDSIGRGLTSSRAGGVEALTVAYPN